ncbi:MAG TPA: DUF3035 domain-containing protein [Patescibacteria group bacterium]|nr:DUF3035 domain-containing protein [Patescibacteria group bacterium]
MKNHLNLLITASLSVLLLGGCGNVKKNLGLERSAPDEFTVVHRAPLSMPPDYGLRPPTPGAPRPQDAISEQQAKTAVFGGNAGTAETPHGSADQALLKNAGADQADDRIRQQVDRETAAMPAKQKTVSEKLLGWTKSKPAEPAATVVDADKEAARLHKAQVEGKAPTEGETPTKQE